MVYTAYVNDNIVYSSTDFLELLLYAQDFSFMHECDVDLCKEDTGGYREHMQTIREW